MRIQVILVGFLIWLVGGVFALDVDPQAPREKILVSTQYQRDWVDSIGKDQVLVYSLLPKKRRPETYTFTQAVLSILGEYETFIHFGENPIELAYLPIVTSYNPTIKVLGPFDVRPKGQPYQIPTIDQSVVYVERVALYLQRSQPIYFPYFQNNINKLGFNMQFLDRKIRTQLARHQGKAFLTDQPYFRRFAADYGIVALELPDKISVTEAIQFARAQNVQVVVSDVDSDRDFLIRVARAIDADMIEVDVFSHNYLHMLESLALNLSSGFIRYSAFSKRRSQ